MRGTIPQLVHIHHSLLCKVKEHGGRGSWKTVKIRGSKYLLWDSVFYIRRDAAFMISQQYCCLNKTNIMTTPLTCLHGQGKSHKVPPPYLYMKARQSMAAKKWRISFSMVHLPDRWSNLQWWVLDTCTWKQCYIDLAGYRLCVCAYMHMSMYVCVKQ